MPVMHKFRKVIVSPGNHKAVKNGSTREFESITPQRIKHWVEMFKKMKALGLKLPNPFVHYDDEGNPPFPVTVGESGELIDPITGKQVIWNAALNGGFWDDLDQDENGCLVGVVEAPGDPDDPNTPAGKLGATIQETSVGIAKRYVAGDGTVFEDVPVHIASCVRAVEANQENFIPLEKGEFSMFSMSTLVQDSAKIPGNTGESQGNPDTPTSAGTTEPKEAIRLLRKFAIDLPDDTSQDNFIERLVLALRQKDADKEDQAEQLIPKPAQPAPPTKQPTGSIEKSGVVTMSEQTTNSEVQENLTLDMTMSVLTQNTKESLTRRIQAIVEKGILTQEQADQQFQGLEMFTMSATDWDADSKKFKPSRFEFALDCLEAVSDAVLQKKKALTTMSTELTQGYAPDGSVEHRPADQQEEEAESADSPFMKSALS